MAEVTLTAIRVEFEVKDVLVVGDPCYIDTDDGKTPEEIIQQDRDDIAIIEQARGKWVATYELCDSGSLGIRVSKLILRRKRTPFFEVSTEYLMRGEKIPDDLAMDLIQNEHLPIKLIGEAEERVTVGVDSGQMGGFCATQTPIDYKKLLNVHSEHCINMGAYMVAFGEGAVSSTGYGDGCYPLTVQNAEDGRPALVTVTFIDPAWDEDDEEFEETK